jgi:outer membrane protein
MGNVQRTCEVRARRRAGSLLRGLAAATCIAVLAAPAPVRAAGSDLLTGVLAEPGGAGLGGGLRIERSMYRDAGVRNDLLPLYMYDGKHIYLHAYRFGLKLDRSETHRFDVFVEHRFEGFPYDKRPASLAGMGDRESGLDAGLSYELRGNWGAAYVEALHNFSDASGGNEVRLGYRYDWKSGRLGLRPYAMLSWRDASLNNYYYGVRPAEATALRPAYEPGAGWNTEIGLFGVYALSNRWRVLGGLSATRWSKGVVGSPIVDGRVQPTAMIGLMYDFSPEDKPWPEERPVFMRALYGKATECDVAKTMRLACTSTQTQDGTRIAGFEIGRSFVERLNGWPFDIAGYVGVMRHDERNVQADIWQLNAYMRGRWYGFPWSDRVMTRISMGAGISYAQAVPVLERRNQERSGRNTSQLLNYLDPTIDISVGDVLGVQSLKKTFFGFGVSHRSGIFGTSQLLGNVNGGSNYIYSYLEWEM